MKRFLGVTLLVAGAAAAQTLSTAEREKAIQHLNATRAAFRTSIKGLSAEQWDFKPAPETWSVGEVAEHITLSEAGILELVEKKIMAAPIELLQVEQARGKDDLVLKAIPDRSEKFKAPEFLQPKARWTQAQIPEQFNASRDRTIELIRTTREDMRSHTLPHPVMKTMDAYQWVLAISAHCQRHTAQIEEVKANPNFPQN